MLTMLTVFITVVWYCSSQWCGTDMVFVKPALCEKNQALAALKLELVEERAKHKVLQCFWRFRHHAPRKDWLFPCKLSKIGAKSSKHIVNWQTLLSVVSVEIDRG